MTSKLRIWPQRQQLQCVRRAVYVAMIVGPIIALINHGDAIWAGVLSQGDILRILVTFFVPFSVSLTSSLLAIREHIQ